MPKQLSSPVINDNNKDTVSAGIAIQTYTAMILKQSDVKNALLPSLPGHQKTARQHATNWNEKIVPQMSTTNADIIGYANEFDSFYDLLVKFAKDSANKDSRAKLVEGLDQLHKTIGAKKTAADGVVKSLNQFSADLATDGRNFAADYQTAQTKIAGEKGAIKALQDKLDAIHSAMQKDIGLMAGGAAAIVGGSLMIAVGVMAEIPSGGASTALIIGGGAIAASGAVMEGIGASDYTKQIDKQSDTIKVLEKDKMDVVSMSNIKNQINGFQTAISSALAAVTSLLKGWQDLEADLKEVIDAIVDVDPTITPDWIVAELDTAKKNWAVALDQAKKMQSSGLVPVKAFKDLKDAFKTKPQG